MYLIQGTNANITTLHYTQSLRFYPLSCLFISSSFVFRYVVLFAKYPVFVTHFTQQVHSTITVRLHYRKCFPSITSSQYFIVILPLAFQQIVGRAGGHDTFGVRVKLVVDVSLEEVHKTII